MMRVPLFCYTLCPHLWACRGHMSIFQEFILRTVGKCPIQWTSSSWSKHQQLCVLLISPPSPPRKRVSTCPLPSLIPLVGGWVLQEPFLLFLSWHIHSTIVIIYHNKQFAWFGTNPRIPFWLTPSHFLYVLRVRFTK